MDIVLWRLGCRHVPSGGIILSLHKKIAAGLLAGLTAFTFLLPLPRAEAVDVWGAAAQALGIFGIYQSSLSSVLAMGNNVHAQIQSRQQDLKENGRDPNRHDIDVVNGVMQQLVGQADYALKDNNLPFIWIVNDSKDFNAACYPTNYVSINRALVRGLNCDPDEIAAVLGHELTHGLEQHSAHNYAKAAAQYYGLSFLNMDAGLMDWNKLAALADYSIAKNVTLPTEYEADKGGFYLMTSAGFNPGGGAAAMARMDYYFTYETENPLEVQSIDVKNKNQENFNDHPDTSLREQKLAALMTDYSAGHVTVKGRKDIYIDGQLFLSADWTTEAYDNTTENAYYIAGGLAKAFHDYDRAADWQFRGDKFLDDNRVYALLHEFTARNHATARLQQLVTQAYAGEAASGAREKLRAAEQERAAKLAAARQESLQADNRTTKKWRENADTYSDYGMSQQALFQMQRVFASATQDDEASSLVIRGRAKAVAGDYKGALQDADAGVAKNPKDIYNFLNRADIYRMAGEPEKALTDLQAAAKVEADNAYIPLMQAQIYDELGDHAQALKNYQALYAREPKAVGQIPEEYLKDVSKKDYDDLMKQKEKAKKQAIEDYKKAHKNLPKAQKSAII